VCGVCMYVSGVCVMCVGVYVVYGKLNICVKGC